ncbi:intraflagellar transport-associated protein isoform X2 [Rhinoderma darwinii]|uniref:intraflagellar transport-associated protein isoform X2 n=1 Tax=Rhinoderma darwinii TaxID=43563 RepID=UPI003F66F4E1
MPSSDGSPSVVADEEMANVILSRFISIPEQTYEEFLSTFTCPPQGSHRQCSEVVFDDSQIKKTSLKKIQTTKEAQDKTDVANEQDEPEQLTIGEGTTVGNCHSLTYFGRVQVDNYFNSSDIGADSDNDDTSTSVLLFPGEADVELSGGNKTIVRNTCLQIHATSGVDTTAEEHLSDEVRPFSLDQSFDYDYVALTSKLSTEEMNFLRLRGPQRVEETEIAGGT